MPTPKKSVSSLRTLILLFIGMFGLFIIAFSLAGKTIHLHTIHKIDFDWLFYLNHNPWLPVGFLQQVSKNSSFICIAILLSFLLIGMRKIEFLKTKFTYLLTCYLGGVLLSNIIKLWVARPRPFNVYPTIQKLSSGGSYSFPSGHTSEVFSLSIALLILFPKNVLSYIFLLWAFLVAYSRMALGVHYPTDIFGGIVLSISWCWMSWWMFRRSGYFISSENKPL